jgi:membrane-bound lytic murein transglycosylase
VSCDATFDENFESALIFDKHPFQGSLAYKRTPAATEMQSFNDQTETQSTGSVTDFITLPQDQSEEGNEHDESSAMSDTNSVTEQTEIENEDENENSNKNNNELENTNSDDVTTDED